MAARSAALILSTFAPQASNVSCHPAHRSLMSFSLKFASPRLHLLAAPPPTLHLSEQLLPLLSDAPLTAQSDAADTLTPTSRCLYLPVRDSHAAPHLVFHVLLW